MLVGDQLEGQDGHLPAGVHRHNPAPGARVGQSSTSRLVERGEGPIYGRLHVQVWHAQALDNAAAAQRIGLNAQPRYDSHVHIDKAGALSGARRRVKRDGVGMRKQVAGRGLQSKLFGYPLFPHYLDLHTNDRTASVAGRYLKSHKAAL